LEVQAHLAHPVHQELLEPPVLQGSQVTLEYQEVQDLQVQQAHKVSKVHLAHLAFKVYRDLKAVQVIPEHLALLATQGMQDKLECQV